MSQDSMNTAIRELLEFFYQPKIDELQKNRHAEHCRGAKLAIC